MFSESCTKTVRTKTVYDVLHKFKLSSNIDLKEQYILILILGDILFYLHQLNLWFPQSGTIGLKFVLGS